MNKPLQLPTLNLENTVRKYICVIITMSVCVILSASLWSKAPEETITSKKESSPLAVTIAVNKTVFFRKKDIEDLPVIPFSTTNKGKMKFFDVVIMNVSEENIKIPRSPHFSLTFKLIDTNGKEYFLSEDSPSFGSSVRRAYNAYVLEPRGCYIRRIYMDWYKFPKSSSRQKIKLQVIYKVKEIIFETRKISPKPSKKRKVNLTKELNLWHGEVRSPLREFIIR
jgi:hypothetical protein